MDKDVDEVGKIARTVKAKIEALNKEVLFYLYDFLYTLRNLRVVSIKC